jgi:hypothetical protein
LDIMRIHIIGGEVGFEGLVRDTNDLAGLAAHHDMCRLIRYRLVDNENFVVSRLSDGAAIASRNSLSLVVS